MTVAITTPDQSGPSRRDIHQAACRALITLLAYTPEDAEVRHWSFASDGSIRGYLSAAFAGVPQLRQWAEFLPELAWALLPFDGDEEYGQIAVTGVWDGHRVEIVSVISVAESANLPELTRVGAR